MTQRWRGGLAAGALIAAAVAVAFGTGFTASRTVLAEGGAWLSSGTTVSHVNAGTGRPDATIDGDLVGEVGDQEVVTTSTGTSVVDTSEGTVTTLDTPTMTPGSTTSLPEGRGRLRFVVAGRFGYLLGDTVVEPVDPVTLRNAEPAIEIGHVGGAVATAEGTLVVLDTETGTAVEVVDGVDQTPVVVTRRPGLDHLALTAVGGRPVVVDTQAGTVRRLAPGSEPEDPIPVDGLAGLTVAGVAIADPHADGSTLWLVRREDGTLLGVDLETREVRSSPLDRQGDLLQSPVVLAGLVYVPHGGSHDVTVVDGRSDALHHVARHEPEGTSDRLEVFAHAGRVWINDPAAPHALVVEPDGRTRRTVDKGTGRDLDDRADSQPGAGTDPPQASAPAPAPGPPPPPTPTPEPPAEAAPPPQADVPRVVGLGRDEACGRIEAAQLVCDDRPVPDAPGRPERDEVVAQEPAGGRLPILSSVVIEYHAPGGAPVPDLAGQRVAQGGDPQSGPACQAVVQAGFACSPEPVAAAEGRPADEVLPRSQQPGAGSNLGPGEDVAFSYAPTTVVPDLAGTTAERACAAVSELNLYCAVEYVPIGATPGQVAGQNPAAGTQVPADSPVARSQVTIQVPQRTSQVPNLVGQDQATACAALQAEQLGCSWEVNPTNSIRNPGLVDAQSIAPGTPVAPGTLISVYHPAGPDATLHRFRARHMGDERFWALAPDLGPGQGIYNNIQGLPDRWAPDGTVGRCYSTQVEGSVPLYGFKRPTPGDEDPAYHFYAAGGPGSPHYERGLRYYPPSDGGKVQLLCYVVPWDAAPGAAYVIEWTKRGTAGHHFYTATDERSPGPLYDRFDGQWMTW